MYQKSDRYVCADYDESVIAELEKLYLWTYLDVQHLTAVHLLEEKADKSWYRLICVQHCMQVIICFKQRIFPSAMHCIFVLPSTQFCGMQHSIINLIILNPTSLTFGITFFRNLFFIFGEHNLSFAFIPYSKIIDTIRHK